MFTGIVQHRGQVATIEDRPECRRIVVDAVGWSHVPDRGDSIAINGCCLTVAEQPAGGLLAFDAIPQTLDVTTLSGLALGSTVNLEHAVTPATLLGGHLVQGHVDGIAEVVRSVDDGEQRRIGFRPPANLMPCMVDKGAVALDGVSLTLAEVDHDTIEVALIPTTLELTTLGDLAIGDAVNVEADYFAKVVINWMERRA